MKEIKIINKKGFKRFMNDSSCLVTNDKTRFNNSLIISNYLDRISIKNRENKLNEEMLFFEE